MKKILVIEDELDIQEIIREFLINSGYEVELACDGLEGIEKFRAKKYDLIILDIMLPKIDGFVVCEIIRKESDIPIIILTALEEEEDQLKGFELKADDYITKPFSISILIKRVDAVLRRSSRNENNIGNNVFEEIAIDRDTFNVSVNGKDVELTVKEFEILDTLMKNQGKVLTREGLLNKLWGYDFYGDSRVIDTHIKNLRHKLDIEYIKTIRGVGYKFEK